MYGVFVAFSHINYKNNRKSVTIVYLQMNVSTLLPLIMLMP